jgi:hypothetical protein
MWQDRFFILGIIALSLSASAASVLAQGEKAESRAQPSNPGTALAETELLKLNDDVVAATKVYRESLERLLVIYERDSKRQAERAQQRRELFQKGYISKLELEESERALADAEAKGEETKLKITEADIVITEALARAELLKLPPLTTGQYMETAGLIRYEGGADWSLADAAKIERFFSETFGRLLPISALGQTPIHDRLKFDHRNALDVALHPDSAEGRALVAYLRTAGIPFIAFRNKVAGSATGAHIHIGKPSPRAAHLP